MTQTIWLRAEVKQGERRCALTPEGAAALLEAGARVVVERSEARLFEDQAYQEVGCELVASNSWETDAPADAWILGLKELELKDTPLVHKHIYFAHAYKGQDEAPQILARFAQGGGEIMDLEFLQDENGRRVCAFGYWAGYVGAAMSVAGFYHYSQSQGPFPAQGSYNDKASYLAELRQLVDGQSEKPRALVIGALGRSGKGSVDLFEELGIEVTSWDIQETQAGGPFEAINDYDILVNCAYLAPGTKPFITEQSLGTSARLKIVSDVSCDPNNPDNPIRIYDAITYLPEPIIESRVRGIYVQAVDHLPTVLPRESSEEFAGLLLPFLLELVDPDGDHSVWDRARGFYQRAQASQQA